MGDTLAAMHRPILALIPFLLLSLAAFPRLAAAQDDVDGDGFTVDDGDCDDCDPSVYPGADELCNGIDDDCDGTVDEDFDDDGDGTGDCHDDDGDGATELGGDCDDTDPDVGPGSEEICNGVDDDCDGAVDEGFDDDGDGTPDCGDDDGDGYTELEGDCDDTTAGISPIVPENCNGYDDNCDGVVDEGFDGLAGAPPDGTSDCLDDDGDGYTEVEGDCDDTHPWVHPAAEEHCEDDVDNDCDGAVDYQDNDCLAEAEQSSGIVCECDYPDPPETKTSLMRRAGILLAAACLLVIRRR